ncbi:MAG TPA: heavy metal-binding domain-containing protein [Oscillatoriaceae cyanobacterium]
MPFWRRETPEEQKRRKRQEASISALEGGRLPLAARHRLENQKRREDGFFTSDLSVNECLVASEAGYESLGLVMGSCFQQVGYRAMRRYYRPLTGEMEAVTHAHTTARERCVQRLALEAKVLGAHGVIGVEVKTRTHPWAMGLVEFTAIGTAIRVPDHEPTAEPFTSHLSGQDFWQLHRAGYWPRALVFGLCAYYVNEDPATRRILTPSLFSSAGWINQEVTQFTHGYYQASHAARVRLSDAVRRHRAQGAVGMQVQEHLQDIEYEINKVVYHDLLVTFVAQGTAVSPLEEAPVATPPKSLMVLDLASGETRSL